VARRGSIVAALLGLIIVLSVPPALSGTGIASHPASSSSSANSVGKSLYREYCGKCHALNQALAAGFGGNATLGQNGGPNFNNLKVSYSLAIVAITQPFPGHEVVDKRLSWTKLKEVATFIGNATKNHKIVAYATDV
jgi:mono/diheme cytochrome c family protein